MPDRCTGLADHLEAVMPDRLPQTEEGAGRIGQHSHPALVLDLHRLDAADAAGGGRSGQRGLDVGGVEVGGPAVRVIPLRVVVHQAGHRACRP